MEIIKALKENNQFEIEMKCSGEQWNKAFKKEYDNAAKNLKVEGFRPGKVPAAIAKKYISEEEIAYRTIFKFNNEILDGAANNAEFLKVKEEVYKKPHLDIVSFNKESATIKLVYDFLPTLTKDYDYKKISLYPTKEETVSEEEINSEIARYQEQGTKVVESKDTTLSKGKIAVFDFTGFVDGVEFEGGKATNYELEIGSNQFIPGFEDQMVGMEVGAEKDINVTFPESYHEKSLAGKPTVFKIKLHSIKEKSTPELNDESVKNMEIPGIETVEQLKTQVKNSLLERVKTANKELVLKSAIKNFLENAELTEISQNIINDELDAYIEHIDEYSKKQGFSLDKILKLSNSTIEDFKKQQTPQIIEKIKTDALITYVANKEKISVDEKDYNEEITKLSKIYGVDEEIVRQRLSINKNEIMKELLIEKVVDKLFDLNKNNEKLVMEEHHHDHEECDCGHEH